MPGCHHSTDWCKETLVWGTEHQSCPGATGELCYKQSQPCSTEHQEPSTLMPCQLLASSRCIPLLQTTLDSCPCCRRALCVQLPDPSSSVSISNGIRSPAGLVVLLPGGRPSVQPGQSHPASPESVCRLPAQPSALLGVS